MQSKRPVNSRALPQPAYSVDVGGLLSHVLSVGACSVDEHTIRRIRVHREIHGGRLGPAFDLEAAEDNGQDKHKDDAS